MTDEEREAQEAQDAADDIIGWRILKGIGIGILVLFFSVGFVQGWQGLPEEPEQTTTEEGGLTDETNN